MIRISVDCDCCGIEISDYKSNDEDVFEKVSYIQLYSDFDDKSHTIHLCSGCVVRLYEKVIVPIVEGTFFDEKIGPKYD